MLSVLSLKESFGSSLDWIDRKDGSREDGPGEPDTDAAASA
jgi:hypothetical protein